MGGNPVGGTPTKLIPHEFPNLYMTHEADEILQARVHRRMMPSKTRETHCEVKPTGDVARFHQQRAVFVEDSVILGGPARWQRAVGLSHHPVGLEDLVQVLCQAGAVVDHHPELLHLKERRVS